MKIIIAILVLLLVFLQYKLWYGPGSIISAMQMQETLKQQHTENDRLTDRNKVLLAEIKDLKQGQVAIEERARNELGMVKRGETFYQVVDQK